MTRLVKSQKYSAEDIKRKNDVCVAEKKLIKEDPLNLIEHEYLSIKVKEAGSPIIKLKLNTPQRILFDLIEPMIKEKKPIRLLLLKSRQAGSSTFISALFYAITSQIPNINSIIIADISEHTNNLFEMSKLYHEKLSEEKPHITPKLKKSNEKKLEFANIHSQIIVATAENIMAATSHTFQLAHLSEASKYRKLKALLSDLSQTVPKQGFSLIILETTANGMEEFYELWTEAVEGKNDYIPLFVPWFYSDECVMPLQNGKLYPLDGIHFSAESTKSAFLVEEDRLRQEEELTKEQINWRRWSIINDSFGDINLFNQENPSSWKVAFMASGANFFDSAGMQRQKKKTPIAVGDIFENGRKYEFRAMPEGKIKLYEYPKSYEEYLITGDASEAVGEDEGSAYVLNKRLNSTAAVVNGQYPAEVLGDIMIKLCNYFNKGLAVPENKGYGTHLAKVIYDNYGYVYRAIKTEKGKQVVSEQIGFNTNLNTRPEMLSRLNEEIRVSATKLIDSDLINQSNTFIINPKTKKAEAALNKQDGLVICRAIAAQVRHLIPYKPPVSEDRSSRALHDKLSMRKNGGFGF